MVSFWPSFNKITDGCIACYLPLKDEILRGIWPESDLRVYLFYIADDTTVALVISAIAY